MGKPQYDDRAYKRRRRAVLGKPCIWCGAAADTAEHIPPLSAFPSPDQWEGEIMPACRRCNVSHRAERAFGLIGARAAQPDSGGEAPRQRRVLR